MSVQQVYDYFAGGHAVTLPREGYEETLVIPKCEPAHAAAVLQAVEQGLVWLTSGPASILRTPPARIPVDDDDGRIYPRGVAGRYDQPPSPSPRRFRPGRA